ncbi:MAG: hypothetical protein B9S32_11945 [Verrucomicrobia bacterium Tous-C9LFEB]|nr:MAG: hypothetical protein B9S32_11945 [Verrucomicrobia bacterium Tous-C9LFEB]
MSTRALSFSLLLAFVCSAGVAWAQTADSVSGGGGAAPASSAPASSGASSGGSSSKGGMLGNDMPFFDPGNEVLSWDGKKWNVNDNRIFRARFEKYLNAEEETAADDEAYRKALQDIMEKITPGPKIDLDEAWSLLPKASKYRIDANLCDSLANAVYTVWLSKREINRLGKANESLEKERETLERNSLMSVEDLDTRKGPSKSWSSEAAAQWAKENEMKRDMRMQPYIKRLAEVEVMSKANMLKKDASELQAKVEFQALIVQFFFQRRFQHVVIGSRFYRTLFGDGDTQLKLQGDAKKLLTDSSGLPPTLSVLDSLANEAMRDVQEGIEAYNFLLTKNELSSATQRLAEAFAVGEYVPAVRTLPREKKRRALEFTQKTNQLVAAIEVKDYARAEKIVKELDQTAKDFDNSKPMAAIETAKTVSALHLAKARNAAASGERTVLENELKAAMEIWPRNPALGEVSGAIFSQADVQQQALSDLDRLLSQKNYRQIFDDKVKFIAATALFPEKQEKLRLVLDKMQTIEGAIIRANEVAKRGDAYGAWESVEQVFAANPEDIKLNQLRADLTTQAAEFVRSLTTARDLESKKQTGSALAWYLKAQQIYPPSDFAREGIARVVKQILPDS